MWLYALSGEAREKILIKTYPVSLGRPDSTKESGILTPLGKFKLGSRIAIYKPKVIGHYKGQKTEMIQVFGTRWIPFETEIGETTLPAKGFGLHGVPWVKGKNGELEEDNSSLGKFESDGCVRMATSDMEEVYAIVITKPAYVELVKDFSQSELIAK
jgi:lipoprotein-anchoring transpeptidase ErfK/SrfK